MNRLVILNSISGALFYAATLVIAFLLTPLIVHTLGTRDYGIWEVFLGICGYLGVLDLGVGPAIVAYVARHSAKADVEGRDRIVSTALVILIATGLAGAVAVLLLGLCGERILNVSRTDFHHLWLLFGLFAANVFVIFAGTTFSAFLLGLQQHYLIYLLRLVLLSVQAVAIYAVLAILSVGAPLVALAGILLCYNVLQFTFFALITLKGPHRPHLGFSPVARATVRDLYCFGLNSTVLMAADRVQRQTMPILISSILGPTNVVFYILPARIVEYARSLTQTLGAPLIPLYSHLEAVSLAEQKRNAWFAHSRLIQFVNVYLALCVLLCGNSFLTLWIGAELARPCRPIMTLLGVSLFIEALAPNAVRYLVGTGKHRTASRILFALSIIAVTTSAALLPGRTPLVVAAVLLCVNAVGAACLLALVCADLGITAVGHLRRTIVPLVIPALSAGFTIASLNVQFPPTDYFSLATHTLAGSALYLGAGWFFTFTVDERRTVLRCLSFRAKPG